MLVPVFLVFFGLYDKLPLQTIDGCCPVVMKPEDAKRNAYSIFCDLPKATDGSKYMVYGNISGVRNMATHSMNGDLKWVGLTNAHCVVADQSKIKNQKG